MKSPDKLRLLLSSRTANLLPAGFVQVRDIYVYPISSCSLCAIARFNPVKTGKHK
ncbi:hypothetical protein [Microcoleus sp. M2_B4]|uniref:hypothetical protein n=1 Tax=Microcoleus sp. M2_B4 TaxID=2818826 RepID=UPI002FD4B152